MFLDFRPVNEQDANLILSKGLDNTFDCYNIQHQAEDIDEMLDEEEYDFFVAYYDESLVGFIECYFENDILEIGLALVPEFVDQGFGTDFVSQGIEYLVEYYDYVESVIRSFISVEDKKAIEAMKRIGFIEIDSTKDWIELEISV
ncbi:MAG: GNAT family N-acetyltransferase [Bacillota bacterium]